MCILHEPQLSHSRQDCLGPPRSLPVDYLRTWTENTVLAYFPSRTSAEDYKSVMTSQRIAHRPTARKPSDESLMQVSSS